jgi:hypothetical protein
MGEHDVNFSPAAWGGSAWLFLHALASALPASTQAHHAFRDVMASLPEVLPCSLCRTHLCTHMPTLPTMQTVLSGTFTRADAVAAVHDLHNTVNLSLGRPQLSHKDATHTILKNMADAMSLSAGGAVLSAEDAKWFASLKRHEALRRPFASKMLHYEGACAYGLTAVVAAAVGMTVGSGISIALCSRHFHHKIGHMVENHD